MQAMKISVYQNMPVYQKLYRRNKKHHTEPIRNSINISASKLTLSDVILLYLVRK